MPSPGGLTRGAGIAIVAVVILGAASGASPGLVGAQATDGPTAISSCTTITEPGAYELTQDIAADSSGEACIVIDLEGTVVLDGQGHSIGGGIDAEAAGEDAAVTLDLRDTTVDFIRYPGGFDGPGASGVLENVRVGTLDLWSASGLTIQSSHVESGIPNGFFAYDVTIRHSTFEGPVRFDENAGEFEVVNNTFAEEVAFWEELTDSRIADNTFRSSLVLTDAGGGPDHVVIEANHFTVAGDRRSAIEFEGGADSVIRNNVIAVEHDAPETDGIFLAHGRQNVIEGNVVQGANNGVFLIDESDSRIVDNTLTDNRIGVKVNSREQVTFERNVLSNNAAFGVQNTDRGAFVFDARNNYWGATDGPSSAPADDPDAPFADPETCALANGSGDAVSEGDRDGVSNVRFDPFLTAPPDETDDGATPTPSPTVTPTRTPEATPSPTETPTPEDTPTSTPEDTPTSTETPMSTPEDPPMSTPEDTPTATPEDTPTATPGDTPTPTPTPEDTPTETDDGETSDEPTEGGDDRPTDASTEDSAEAGGTDTEVVIVAGTRSPAETDGQPGFGAIVALVAITLAALIGRRWRA